MRLLLTAQERDLLDSALCDALMEARANLTIVEPGSQRELDLRGRLAGVIALRQTLHSSSAELELEKVPA